MSSDRSGNRITERSWTSTQHLASTRFQPEPRHGRRYRAQSQRKLFLYHLRSFCSHSKSLDDLVGGLS